MFCRILQTQILFEKTLCRTFLYSVSDSCSDNNQSVTLPGRWGCFRVDCLVCVCLSEGGGRGGGGGVLSDLWGTQISNRPAILNIPINPWGCRGGWLLETHWLNKTPWWDPKLINKPPQSVWSYFCPFTWVTWLLTTSIHTGLFYFRFSVQHCSLLNDWVIKCEWERKRVSSSIPAPPHFQLLVAIFFVWPCWNCKPQKVMTFCRLEEKSLAECWKPSIDFH